MRCGSTESRSSSTTWRCALIESPCRSLSPACSRPRIRLGASQVRWQARCGNEHRRGDGDRRGRQLPSAAACTTIRRPSGRSSAWQSARFGTVRPVVQIHSPRPAPSLPPPRKAPHPTFRTRFSRIDGPSLGLAPIEHFLVAGEADAALGMMPTVRGSAVSSPKDSPACRPRCPGVRPGRHERCRRDSRNPCLARLGSVRRHSRSPTCGCSRSRAADRAGH